MSLMLLQFADSKSNLAFWKLGIDIIDIAHVRRKVPFMTMMQQLKVYCNYKDRMVDIFRCNNISRNTLYTGYSLAEC